MNLEPTEQIAFVGIPINADSPLFFPLRTTPESMGSGAALSLRSCSFPGCQGPAGNPRRLLRIQRPRTGERRHKPISLRGLRQSDEQGVSCSCKKRGAVESETTHASSDEASILKRKSKDIAPYLHGRCIYLVGMMGSGKTTVGKILSEVLGYSFFDSDKLVEQAVGISSVVQIFKDHSEAFFRDNERDALRDLSSMSRLVVATGGGAVIRPVNWRYMKQGVTVWLDVPLDVLARRIAAVGTESRPLLHREPGDPYTKAFMRLSMLYEDRGEAYANADARVCLKRIAAKQGHDIVSSLTPTAIAIEALLKIESFLTENAPVGKFSYLQE